MNSMGIVFKAMPLLRHLTFRCQWGTDHNEFVAFVYSELLFCFQACMLRHKACSNASLQSTIGCHTSYVAHVLQTMPVRLTLSPHTIDFCQSNPTRMYAVCCACSKSIDVHTAAIYHTMETRNWRGGWCTQPIRIHCVRAFRSEWAHSSRSRHC